MKYNFIHALAATALFIAAPLSVASAADMPLKAPPPPPAPIYNWTGFYIGVNAGYTWNNDSVNMATAPTFLDPALSANGLTNPILTSAAATGNFRTRASGFIGGGQIGYNWQIGAAWVAGIETDFQGVSSHKGSSTTTFVQPRLGAGDNQVTTVSVSQNLRDLGTLRGRLGVLVTPSFLAYGTGGLAYGGVNSSNNITTSEVPNTGTTNGASFGSSSNTRAGWTIGGGAEWMFAPKWSAKLEYLYYDLGTANYAQSMTTFAGAGGPVAYVLGTSTSTRFNGNIIRVGLNYKLN